MCYSLEIVSAVFLLTCVFGEFMEGDPCTLESTGQKGRCRHFSRCAFAVEEANQGKPPEVCTFDGTVAVVCCPLVKVVEGNNCIMEGTLRKGACTKLADCRVAMLAASRGILPEKCDPYSFGAEGQLICCSEPCPPLSRALVSQQPSGSKAADYCIELAGQIYSCQRTTLGWTRGDICPAVPDPSAVYDGTQVNSTTDVPHFGKLGISEEGHIKWKGAVTLLSDRWGVTTAYTIQKIGYDNVKFVGLGVRWNPFSVDVTRGVVRIVLHPEYNPTTSFVYNSIALVEVDRKVKFTSRILPACLHTITPVPNSGLIQTGWDLTLKADLKISMRLIPQEECSRLFTPGSWHRDGVKHHIEICGRPLSASGPCEGAGSGSPLFIYNGPRVSCTHLLVGILSARHQNTCSFTYTRIASYVPWIESIVWP